MARPEILERLKILRETAISILLGNHRVPYPPEQFQHLVLDVADVLSRTASTIVPTRSYLTGDKVLLSPQDEDLLREVVEELKREGILIDGLNAANPRWPFFRLTTRAEDILQSQNLAQFTTASRESISAFETSGTGMNDSERSNTVSAPKAFISYSWDNESHKQWVREFAARLRADGVDATLDQWSLAPGDRLPHFMETAVRENSYVIVVCTEIYKNKSDNRKGGVGYEGDVMTAEVYAKGNHRKFVPVLRCGDWNTSVPSWLSGKYSIDLSADPFSEIQYEDLLATLHNVRDQAPPIGTSPNRVPATVSLREAVKQFLPTKEPASADFDPIRIVGVLADEAGEPLNDGTRGCALYMVPIKLSRAPTAEWSDEFMRTWDRPPQYTTRHRPGIARIQGDRIVLTRTTIDEIADVHRDTLKLVVDAVNKSVAQLVRQRHAAEEVKAEKDRQHKEHVKRIANDIKFDES